MGNKMTDMIVLLSDPDAELSSWPLELVALRERIHADKSSQEKEIPVPCGVFRSEYSCLQIRVRAAASSSFYGRLIGAVGSDPAF
ncbi:jg20229 [Pararge aegeria aegeria]|uniref:Jg20229 protein n=1 Tax=Pararge aegeria aegeria TaxID=348720 RepID=A0A8S4R3W8_9NEOP|nr:jg20229 [Pararge aegeria aegeria]